MSVDAVVKVGGGLLAQPAALEAALEAVIAASTRWRVAVIPGGGPFADAVRGVDARVGLSDSAAHWMAVLGMDQYAYLLASRRPSLALVRTRDGVADALRARRVPVLAPADWLRADDPLPHSWDVTSDSIAAWLAGALGARRLVLLKPAGVRDGPDVLDAYFARALPPTVGSVVLGADQLAALPSALGESHVAR